MERILFLTLLYDFYNELLTEKQRVFFARYHFDDMSLNEMGAEFGITPQGVRDLLKRTEKLLESYEAKLHLVQRHLKLRQITGEMIERIQGFNSLGANDKAELIECIQSLVE